MNTIWVLFIKDWKLFLNDKVAVFISYLVPAMLIFVMGNVFDIGGKKNNNVGPSGIRIAIVDTHQSRLSQAIVADMKRSESFRVTDTYTNEEGVELPLTEQRARDMIFNNRLRYALIIDEQFIEDGFKLRMKWLINGRNRIETQMAEGLLQKTLFTSYFSNLTQLPSIQEYADRMAEGFEQYGRPLAEWMADQYDIETEEIMESILSKQWLSLGVTEFSDPSDAQTEGNDGEDPGENLGDAFLGEMLQIEQEQVFGKQVKNIMATISVAGYAMMFMLFAISSASANLHNERLTGIYLRLLSSPVTRSDILWSKYIYNVSVAFSQVVFLFLVSWVIFRTDIFNSFGQLLLVCLFVSAVVTCFGMLLAAFSKNFAQANGVGTLLILSMSAVGGVWFPVSMLPESVQVFSKFTITYWSMEAFLATLYEGKNIIEMLPILGVLTAITVGITAISMWRFKRADLF